MRESHKRSITKGVSWRVIASTTTMLLVFIFTGNLAIVASVGVVDIAAKIFFYYLHERVWGKVHWGTLGTEPRFPVSKSVARRRSVPKNSRKLAVKKRSI